MQPSGQTLQVGNQEAGCKSTITILHQARYHEKEVGGEVFGSFHGSLNEHNIHIFYPGPVLLSDFPCSFFLLAAVGCCALIILLFSRPSASQARFIPVFIPVNLPAGFRKGFLSRITLCSIIVMGSLWQMIGKCDTLASVDNASNNDKKSNLSFGLFGSSSFGS